MNATHRKLAAVIRTPLKVDASNGLGPVEGAQPVNAPINPETQYADLRYDPDPARQAGEGARVLVAARAQSASAPAKRLWPGLAEFSAIAPEKTWCGKPHVAEFVEANVKTSR